jgi:hypothetical protein
MIEKDFISLDAAEARLDGDSNGYRYGDDDFAPDEPALKAKRKKPNGTKTAVATTLAIDVRKANAEAAAQAAQHQTRTRP